MIHPKERPIIDLHKNECTGNLNNATSTLNISMKNVFKNVGNHPTKDLRIRVGGCESSKPQNIKNFSDVTAANNLNPGTDFNNEIKLSIPVSISGGTVSLPQLELIIYVRLSYKSAWRRFGRTWIDEVYLSYIVGHSSAAHATISQRDAIRTYVRKIYS
ncbi:MAG: hypothetical protein IH948_07375 [Bacteroidetes bacterium]|nr:hypothetical protein [Bacteroidota bacterium]